MLKDGFTRAEFKDLYSKAIREYQKQHNLNICGQSNKK